MPTSLKQKFSQYFLFAARACFALTLILAPFRWRVEVWSRPLLPLYSDYTDFLLFLSDFTLIYTLLFWGCSLLLEPRKVSVGHLFVWICLVGVTAAGWVSILGSEDATLSLYHAIRFVLLLFLYVFIVNEIASVIWVVIPAAAQALIQTPVAIGQYLLQSSLGLKTLGEHVLDPQQLGISIIPVNGERILRGYGLTDHPNILGGCLAFALVLLLGAGLYGTKRQPLWASIGFMLVFPALLITFSRSAWLSFFVAASFMVACEALARRWDSVKRTILLGVMSLSLAAPLFLASAPVFEKRFNSGNVAGDNTMFERTYLLGAGNTLFVEHSTLGVGLGASPLAMMNRFGKWPLSYQPPHYVPLTVALETGVMGGIFYLLLSIAPAVIFLFRWRNFIQSPVALGAFALLLAISIVNLFDYYTWYYVPGRLWQWLAWGGWASVWNKQYGMD